MHRLLYLLAFLLLPTPAAAQLFGDLADRAAVLSEPVTEAAGKVDAVTFRAAPGAEAFTGVVAQGFASGGEVEGWIRFEEDGALGGWEPLYVVTSATDDGAFLAGYRGEAIRLGHRFELRFDVAPGTPVQLLGAGVYDGRQDERADDGWNGSFIEAVDYRVFPPAMIPRSEWGAAAFRGDMAPLARPDYRYLTFHHAAGFNATTREQGLAQVKAIQEFHQNGRGWSDIGYQFVIDPAGNLYQGRPFLNGSQDLEEVPPLILGAHVGGHNTGNIGICLLGCYHPSEGLHCRQNITEEALDTYVTTFAFLAERYGVDPANIMGHRDHDGAATACPGDNNHRLLPDIRERVRTLLVTGNAPLGRVDLAAAADEDGVVVLSWSFLEDNGLAAYRIERAYLDTTTVIYRGHGAAPAQTVDRGVDRPGQVVYRLYGEDGQGRDQILAAITVEVGVPDWYILAESFPNPFTTSATVRYYLPRAGHVTLRVYDVLGREVGTLVEDFQDGDQWYTATLPGSGLPAGTYFARLTVEGFSSVEFDRTTTLVRVP